MSQLKPSFVEDVRKALASSNFTPEDFSVELPKSGKVLFRILFIHKPEYSFALLEDQTSESVTVEQKYLGSSRTERVTRIVFYLRMTPGQYKLESSEEVSSPGDAIEQISKWCSYIRADLYALAPKKDPFEKLREELQRSLDDLIQEPNAYFSQEELNVIDERFDQLYQEIASLKEQHGLTKQQMSDLQKEIEEFKRSARAYPKGIWARLTGNRLVKAAAPAFGNEEASTQLTHHLRRALGRDNE